MITEATTLAMPAAPATLEESGLAGDLVLQIVLKSLHLAGELTGFDLAKRLGVRFAVIEPALEMLKQERQCEIVGGALLGRPSYRYRITDAGRVRASMFLRQNQYVGQLPVPLKQYTGYMKKFLEEAPLIVSRESVRRAFSKLVLSERILHQLGPAIASGHSIFIYGPPGNGKTVISQEIRNLLTGEIAIPHAIEVEGQIVRQFDPVNHEALPVLGEEDHIEAQAVMDHRWVRCLRPLLTVGGELDLDALDLGYSESTGFYRAPLQALANGGVLVIDDFGRQRIPPRDLLNRWIVPLESRVDYLTLRTGQKFELPFGTLVVFATNLSPASLVDEAFLRRIQYKIFAEPPTVEEFKQIFANCCHQRGLEYDERIVDFLIEQELRPRNVPLRGCQPRDLIGQALALATYLERPRALAPDLLTSACASYFIDDQPVPTL